MGSHTVIVKSSQEHSQAHSTEWCSTEGNAAFEYLELILHSYVNKQHLSGKIHETGYQNTWKDTAVDRRLKIKVTQDLQMEQYQSQPKLHFVWNETPT